MGYLKKTILLLRDFYPDVERKFILRMSESGWNFSLVKKIANDFNLDLQRALSDYLENFGLNVIDVIVSSEEFQKKWEETFFPKSR
jgi:hypothetical protein